MSIEKTSFRMTIKKLNGDSLTPILIFRRLQGSQRFLLESSSKHDGSGRYSFIGVNPLKTYYGGNGKIEEIIYESGKTYTHEGDLYVLLKRLMPRVTNDMDFPFTGGAVGYVSYDAARKQEKEGLGTPDVNFNIYDTVIIFDHELNEVTLLHTQIHPEHKVPNLEELAEQILSGPIEEEQDCTLSEFRCDTTKEEFEDLVRQSISYIQEGEVEQIVLSRRMEADFQGDPLAIYRKLRKRNPSPYMYYMEFEDHTVIGASPESLVNAADGKVMTNPIAGTRKRGKEEAEDQALEKELRNDPKELEEHDMLVELSKREMIGVCDPSSIQVATYMKTVRYEHVMHLVSEVEGTLAQGLHALDALKATLPAGTVSGSPKQRAMELIDELEGLNRGIYGGAIGYIGLNGNIDFALTIRTMLLKDGKAYVQAGAGIVKDSVPALEYKETENKARSLVEIIK